MITIEKGIDIPKTIGLQNKKGRSCKYPFRILEVGDSFVYRTNTSQSNIQVARQVCQLNGKKYKKEFVYAVIDDVIRIWRTK